MMSYSPTLKKGKVRVRVVDESMKTRFIFCLMTKDSQITEKMTLTDSLLLGTRLGESLVVRQKIFLVFIDSSTTLSLPFFSMGE